MDDRVWPNDLMMAICEVVETPYQKPDRPLFSFKMDKESAAKNFYVLKRFNMNLGSAIEAQRCLPLGYGSEFRDPDVLAKIFGKHPVWNRMKGILKNGSRWPLEELDEEQRAKDVKEALEFGNHKGATTKPELLNKLIAKDVTHGMG